MAKNKAKPAPNEPLVVTLTKDYVQLAGPTMPLKRAATLVGFSVSTLSTAIRDGRLIVSRPAGGRIVVTARRLAEWIVNGEQP